MHSSAPALASAIVCAALPNDNYTAASRAISLRHIRLTLTAYQHYSSYHAIFRKDFRDHMWSIQRHSSRLGNGVSAEIYQGGSENPGKAAISMRESVRISELDPINPESVHEAAALAPTAWQSRVVKIGPVTAMFSPSKSLILDLSPQAALSQVPEQILPLISGTGGNGKPPTL